MRDTLRDAMWVVPVTVFAMLGTHFSGASDGSGGGSPWPAIALTGLAGIAVLGARCLPEIALTVSGVAVGCYFLLGYDDGPINLPPLLVGFVVALRWPPSRWVPFYAGAVLIMLGGLTVNFVAEAVSWWQISGRLLGALGLAAGAAAAGSMVRSRRAAERERRSRAATEEQLRMARDLHDGVGHGLAVIAMQAGVALHVLDRDPAGARAALEGIRDTSRESLASLRGELSRLSGAADPAERTPRPGLADLDTLADRVRAAGLAVEVHHRPEPMSAEADAAAYAIVQEALTNVLRHAEATRVTVEVGGGEPVRVSIVDDGRGGAVPGEGMGISGMRARAEALGGRLSAGPRAEGGFEVRVELP